MHFALTSEQELAKTALRELLREHCSATHLRRVFDASEPTRVPGLWEKLNALGVIGALAPEASGGLSLDAIYLTVLLEETGRAAVPELVVETAAIAVPLLAALPTDPRAAQALQRILAGASVAVCLGSAVEPYAAPRGGVETRGSAVEHYTTSDSAVEPYAAPRGGVETRGRVEARDEGASVRASQQITARDGAAHDLIVGAELATLILCARGGELHLFDRSCQQQHVRGLRLTPIASVDRARRVCRIEIEPSPATCLARGAQAQQLIAAARDHGALGTAAQLVGLGQRMLELTIAHVKTRKQFGQAIGAFQAVKHQLVDARLGLEFAAPLVYRAAHSLAHNDPQRSLHVSMAKAFASDAALLAARKALQLHGAIGYSYEYELQLYMKRVWALAAAYGDARGHRQRIADVFLKGELHA